MRSAPENQPPVSAIVVTYYPADGVVENIRLLAAQFAEVVVIDNGSPPSFASVLSSAQALPGVSLIRNPVNSGIAAALNTGIRHAQDSGFDWFATFDQDSAITPEYVRTMQEAYAACPFRHEVALVSPKYCESATEWKSKQTARQTCCYRPIQAAITSGSLIAGRAFEVAGWFDEAMFIDYVDFDFCLRLRKKGFRTIQSTRTFLIHRLGTSETHSFMGFPVSIKSHNATRYYYIMRNRVVMYRRCAIRFPLWAANDMMWLCLDLIKIIFFEGDKSAKLRNTMKGIRDGMKGLLGPLPASTPATK